MRSRSIQIKHGLIELVGSLDWHYLLFQAVGDGVVQCTCILKNPTIMSDSDSGSAGSVAHAPKARKGQNGQVAKLRDQFEHPISQALTVVPARRSARVASAGQLYKTSKRCRSSAQPSRGETLAASSTADPSAQPPTGLPADPFAGGPTGLPADTLAQGVLGLQ